MIPSVIEKVVDQNLCIGCGICVTSCRSKSLVMSFDNNFGIEVPKIQNDCEGESDCIKVCPFNPQPENKVFNEDLISKTLKLETNKRNKHFGGFQSIYGGYSKEYRETSSSGGIATWLLTQLLNNNYVDAVIVVESENNSDSLYSYKKVTNVADLIISSKTKYYPLSLNEIIDDLNSVEETFAITAIPCFLKAIRLKQHYDVDFNKKVKFTIGIFCGGLKTTFFTDYLSSRCNVDSKNIEAPQYRVKNDKSSATDYSFSVTDKSSGQLKKIEMKEVGDMWGTGLFKPNPCEFCDDLSSELADVSLGDAWIPPYDQDGRGNNIIITRSKYADSLIKKGLEVGDLVLDHLSEDQAEASQRGNINHRHKGLSFRLFLRRFSNNIKISKRIKPSLFVSPLFILVLFQREKVRKKSFFYWKKYENAKDFDNAMFKSKMLLKRLTYCNSQSRRIKNKLLKVFSFEH